MQQNFSPKLEMQIPYENSYTGTINTISFEDEFNKLSKDYNVHNEKKLKEFIRQHEELISYFNKITQIINEFFPKYEKCITFNVDSEFEELNHAQIYIIGNEELFNEERETLKNLNDEVLYLKEFPGQIKKLLSIGLWWL